MENNIVGEYTFKVFPSEVDFRKKLTLPNLTNYLLNSAGNHAEIYGFGLREVNQNNLSWVLSRIVIEMYKYPYNRDKIKVQTWVESVMKMFTMRNFEFLDKNGETIGYARTIWALIDKDSRKPIDLVKQGIPFRICDTKECPIAKASKIPTVKADVKETFSVKYSDVDLNHHLNSSKYIEHIIDAFTLHKFSKRDIKRFEIEFLAECKFGENISLLKCECPNNEFIVELQNEEGKIVSKSKIVFGDQDLDEKYDLGV